MKLKILKSDIFLFQNSSYSMIWSDDIAMFPLRIIQRKHIYVNTDSGLLENPLFSTKPNAKLFIYMVLKKKLYFLLKNSSDSMSWSNDIARF